MLSRKNRKKKLNLKKNKKNVSKIIRGGSLNNFIPLLDMYLSYETLKKELNISREKFILYNKLWLDVLEIQMKKPTEKSVNMNDGISVVAVDLYSLESISVDPPLLIDLWLLALLTPRIMASLKPINTQEDWEAERKKLFFHKRDFFTFLKLVEIKKAGLIEKPLHNATKDKLVQLISRHDQPPPPPIGSNTPVSAFKHYWMQEVESIDKPCVLNCVNKRKKKPTHGRYLSRMYPGYNI